MREARSLFDNIRKCLKCLCDLLSSNMGEVLTVCQAWLAMASVVLVYSGLRKRVTIFALGALAHRQSATATRRLKS